MFDLLLAHFEELEGESAVLAALQPEPPADAGPLSLHVDGDEPLAAGIGVGLISVLLL